MSDLNNPVPEYALIAVLAFGLAVFAAIVLWSDMRAAFRRYKERRHARNAPADPNADLVLYRQSAAVHGDRVRAGNDDGDPRDSEPYFDAYDESITAAVDNDPACRNAKSEAEFHAALGDLRNRRQNSYRDHLNGGEQSADRQVYKDEHDPSRRHPQSPG